MRLKELSRTIGLSPTTISQALSGTGRVSPATREMVRRRVKELGYVPNPHAQQLVTGRSRMVILHHTNQDILSDLFLVEMTHGIQLALHRRGYGLVLDTASDFTENNSLLNHWLASGAVDGVILIKGWSDVDRWVRQAASAATPVVVYGDCSEIGLPHIGNLLTDNSAAICQVVDCLIDAGHRRIGYLGHHDPDSTLSLFRTRLESRGVSLPDEMVVCAGFTPAAGALAVRHLLSLPEPPTAVFCRKDDLAIGAMSAAAGMGIKVPEQLSLIGHDDVPLAAVMDPPLTTVRFNSATLGDAAADLLLRLLSEPDSLPPPVTIEAALVQRASVARIGAGEPSKPQAALIPQPPSPKGLGEGGGRSLSGSPSPDLGRGG